MFMKEYDKLTTEEKELLVKQAMDTAAETETLYGNCMQSVLNGLYKTFPDMGITPEMIKAGFGMAGGCCISLKGTCGALSAAAFAISLFYGRPVDDFPGYYDDCQALIRTVMDEFEERYGGVLCWEVLKHNLGEVYDWKTEEGYKGYEEHNGTPSDAEVVSWCAGKVARMIVEGRLSYGECAWPDVENDYFKSAATLEKVRARKERFAAMDSSRK